MIAIILAAGYGTRLYPKTLNISKAFLKYKNKYIIDHIVKNLRSSSRINKIFIVSNDKFYNQFHKHYKNERNIYIYNNGSTCLENKLGAGKDLINFLIKEQINNDIIVTACDNILNFKIEKFVSYFETYDKNCLMYYKEKNINILRKTGQVIFDKNKVVKFKEKPNNLLSKYAVPPCYIFKKSCIKNIIKINLDSDSMGELIEKLYKNNHFSAFKMPGKRIDFGT